MKTELKIHPIIFELRTECENLREGLAGLIVERDRLKNKFLPLVEIEYAAKLGELMKCLLTLEYESRAMKRRIELVQAKINRNEPINPAEIESRIQCEFQDFLDKIEKQEIKNREAEFLERCEYLSAEESRELQTLYRRLAKKLHPDFAENRTAKHQEIWLQVSAAYQENDLETLRSFDLVIDALLETETVFQTESSLEILEKQKSKIKDQTEKIIREVAEIRISEKFRVWENLNDAVWCEKQRESLCRQIKDENKLLQKLTEIFQNLLSEIRSDDDWAEIIL